MPASLAKRFTVATLAALATLLPLPTWASDWIDVKDAKELAPIYSNKTIRGLGWVGHYRADGRGFIIAPNTKPAGRKWFIKGEQGCATLDSGPTLCFGFQRHRDNPNLIRILDAAQGMNYTATVEDGIPDFEPFEQASRK